MQPAAQGVEVDPGEHVVAASAPGRQPFDQRFQIKAGQQQDVRVQLASASVTPSTNEVRVQLASSSVTPSAPPVVPPARPPDDDHPSTSARFPTGPVILGGASGVIAAVGIIVRIKNKSDYDNASALCTDGRCQSQAEADDSNAARDRMLAGTVVAGAGLAGIAGAGIWWALSGTSTEKAGSSSSVSLQAVPSAEGYWVRVNGRF
jgi:hypothetical protein